MAKTLITSYLQTFVYATLVTSYLQTNKVTFFTTYKKEKNLASYKQLKLGWWGVLEQLEHGQIKKRNMN